MRVCAYAYMQCARLLAMFVCFCRWICTKNVIISRFVNKQRENKSRTQQENVRASGTFIVSVSFCVVFSLRLLSATKPYQRTLRYHFFFSIASNLSQQRSKISSFVVRIFCWTRFISIDRSIALRVFVSLSMYFPSLFLFLILFRLSSAQQHSLLFQFGFVSPTEKNKFNESAFRVLFCVQQKS